MADQKDKDKILAFFGDPKFLIRLKEVHEKAQKLRKFFRQAGHGPPIYLGP